MKETNILMLRDTLEICQNGFYKKEGRRIPLKLSPQEMKEAVVFLPKDVRKMTENKVFSLYNSNEQVAISCENMDSFSLARKRLMECKSLMTAEERILVLNFANAVNPGGGVRIGASAQEEDLCRKSSLLLSLESLKARPYYDYNKSLGTNMGSDAIILSPYVEIIKDEKGVLLDETVVVSVISCAAPNIRNGMEGMSEKQYRELLSERIRGILAVAAENGYNYIVLGAFGCGAFRNDAKIVSDIFYNVMRTFRRDTMWLEDCFRGIDFAVLDHSEEQYNFKEFYRNFANYYEVEKNAKAEEIKKKIELKERNLDKIRGSLIGGAAGDALGYAIEFDTENSIFSRFGKDGITEYMLRGKKKQAWISDDTQMTLFTANGLLVGRTRLAMRGIGSDPHHYVAAAYHDWLLTQDTTFEEVNARDRHTPEGGRSWLLDIKELYDKRAPGTTCLSALRHPQKVHDYLTEPVNNSKGCGGIMRVAPLALLYDNKGWVTIEELDKEGARIAAITHGHPLGFMPAAVVVHIINRLIYGPADSLKKVVIEARDTCKSVFEGFAYLDDMTRIIDLAIELSENRDDDLDNIHRLGEGWVAEETLGIALYCALKYQHDFSKALITSVNHKGDSDSTGAVTGNILGALVGYDAIDDKWKQNLEIHDVILEMADDLCRDCQMSEFGGYVDPAWVSKYMHMHRYVPEITKENRVTFFWKHTEQNGQFSNFYDRKIVMDDFEYFCAEQYIMAQKAKLFHDSERYTKILRAETPEECKRLGREVTPFQTEKWDEVKYDVVKIINKAKYEQHADLLNMLLDTGDSLVAEASPSDAIWGIGLDAETAKTTSAEKWPGKNLLGKILMELRNELKDRQMTEQYTEVRLIKGDITKQTDMDAIVNAANTTLLGGGGVDGAIHIAAGPELLKECRELQGCKVGEAKITKAYNLQCKNIIHAVGPIWNGGHNEEEKLLADVYRNSLELATKNGLRRIAFPSISTGGYKFPVEKAAEIALCTVREFVESHPGALDIIEWVLFDKETYDVYDRVLEQIQ